MVDYYVIFFLFWHKIQKELKELSVITITEVSIPIPACLCDRVSQHSCLQKLKNRNRIDAEPSFILAIDNHPWNEGTEGKVAPVSLRDTVPVMFMCIKFLPKL